MKRLVTICALLLLAVAGCIQPGQQTRLQSGEEVENDKDLNIKTIGDVTKVANVGLLQISGVGLVTGLEGTGGGIPKGLYYTMLEEDLRKKGVENVKGLMNSENGAPVLVTALIPAGARKGDKIDIQVTLPPESRATSLRGGVLERTALMNVDTTQHLNPNGQGTNKLLKGHTLAYAGGPLLVGFGTGDDPGKLKMGRIWQGGVSLTDRPFFLVLETDQKFVRVANAIADRLNITFHEDSKKRLAVLQQVTDGLNTKFSPTDSGLSGLAKAYNKESVQLRLPWEYRLNPARFLRVARLVPLREGPDVQVRYRRKLEERLLDPAHTITAALRLEALGKDSIPPLKKGLESENLLVRFAAAEALAYLGSTAGGEDLAELAERAPPLRAYCLAALTSLNEAVSQVTMTKMLRSDIPSLRYPAFRALREMDPNNPLWEGELLNESFWLHRVARDSSSMVHLSTSRRVEIVLFGEEPFLKTPLKILAGPEFTITAEREDTRCTVSRFSLKEHAPERHQCSLRLHDVLKTMADMGGTYGDAVDFLRQAKRDECLSCPLWEDALPQAPSVEELAQGGRDPNFLIERVGMAPSTNRDDSSAPTLFNR